MNISTDSIWIFVIFDVAHKCFFSILLRTRWQNSSQTDVTSCLEHEMINTILRQKQVKVRLHGQVTSPEPGGGATAAGLPLHVSHNMWMTWLQTAHKSPDQSGFRNPNTPMFGHTGSDVTVSTNTSWSIRSKLSNQDLLLTENKQKTSVLIVKFTGSYHEVHVSHMCEF